MKRARWRPVCPECGYSLRGLRQPRCPECGIGFPTESRTFRRWAFRRLAWDRCHREGIITAYVNTFDVLLRPWQGGRATGLPDRWARAVRWAAAHVLLLAITSTLLAHGQYYCGRFLPMVLHIPTLIVPDVEAWRVPSPGRAAVWMTQSVLAWSLAFATLPLVGSLVSLLALGRHRAAKWAGVKWSLYLLPIAFVGAAAWCVYHVPVVPFVMPVPRSPPQVAVWFVMIVYAAWWAIGMAAEPYTTPRRRRPVRFISYFLAFVGVWLCIAQLAFRPGLLEEAL